MDLEGAKVLVTGASGGIGHALARDLHAAGAELVLHGRRAELLSLLADETGGEVIVGDLGDRAHVDDLMARTADIDVLVANAGLGSAGRFLDNTEAQVDLVLDVNLRVPIQMARFYGQQMAERRRGHIVFISSMAAKATGANAELYSATKFGLRGFALGFRDAMSGTGVGVTVVLPGFVSGVGMFAEGGGTVPGYVGTVTAEQVAEGTRKGIEQNRTEVIVASMPVRVGGQFALIAPNVASFIANRTPLGGLRPD